MINPFEVESKFQELVQQLPSIPSKRAKLSAIISFIELIPNPVQQYESYLLQLVPLLPVFKTSYEYTGISPLVLQQQGSKIKEIYSIILDSNIAELEEWFAKFDLAIQSIYNWLGERGNSEDISNAISIFDERKTMVLGIHTVLVPVLEKDNEEFSGRLRNLQISVAGQSNSGKHDLVPVFSVMSTEEGSEVITQRPAKSVNNLIDEYQLNQKKYWQATAGFENKHAWHSGNSANLAMSGLFFCSILEAMDKREQFRLNPAIVITGDISERGEVLPVSNESLKAKVEAAFFSWSQVLVAPSSQLGEIYSILEGLREQFPRRGLIAFGATQLKDLFYDRRLTIHSKKGYLKYLTTRAWKKRFNVVSLLVFIVLIGIITALVIGPIDRNPTLYRYEGTEIVLMNQSGRELKRIEVGEHNIYNATKSVPAVKHQIISLLDIDENGKNEILLNLRRDDELQQSELTLLSSNLKDTLWTFPLEFDDHYEKHPYAFIKGYRGRVVEINDIDGDDELEILITAEQNMYFKGIFAAFDANTGRLEQTYRGAGWFSQILIEDFDLDGSKDMLLCGHFKGFELFGCSLFDGKEIEGYSPLHERYFDGNKTQAIAKLHFAWDGSIMLKYLNRLSNREVAYPSIYASSKFKSNQLLALTFLEGVIKGSNRNLPVSLIYTFDYHFNPKAIASTDYYDFYSEQLFNEGELPFLPEPQYLHTLRDSIYWWNGNDWVQKPTLNKKYLELAGDDSSYYQDWYFTEVHK